jgi:hypothetical protein
MIRSFLIWPVAAFVFFSLACNQPPSGSQGRVAEAYTPDYSGSVGFDIAPIQGANGYVGWIGTYSSEGKTSRFRIELGPAKLSQAKDSKDFSIKFGEGKFVGEPGSDAGVFLANLGRALEATVIPTKTPRLKNLPFTFVSLGENMSRASNGGFNENPPGNWTAMKIFLGEGDKECEVFLNVNPAIGKGEFSIKDPDYGNLVLAELAKVL